MMLPGTPEASRILLHHYVHVLSYLSADCYFSLIMLLHHDVIVCE